MTQERVTERTLYAPMIRVIGNAGGSGVQEVQFNSVPDIVFTLGGSKWLLSVKIGDDAKTVKDAFLQYQRHKEESGIRFGLIVFFGEDIRSVLADERTLLEAVRTSKVTSLIDAGVVKEEFRDRSFSQLIHFLQNVVLVRLARHEQSYFPMARVIDLLRVQLTETMADLPLGESNILQIITDQRLLMDLGHLEAGQVEEVGRFLASYILMSQVLFLRLLISSRPEMFSESIVPISRQRLRSAFNRVLEINYKPIYAIEVLDAVAERHVRDTFDLIWGLEIERVRYELPGRIFHELMPPVIRKMLAAFYTRPQAADVLTHLAIPSAEATVLDPACGSGTILTAAYRQKRRLFDAERSAGNPHARFCESEIFGADIMPFAVHLTSANLSAMDAATTITRTQVFQADSLELSTGSVHSGGINPQIQGHLFPLARVARMTDDTNYEVKLDKVDVVVMNPPFTKVERGIRAFVNMSRFSADVGGEVGLWGHFIALADRFLKDGGIFGGVIPINALRGRESGKVREILFRRWTPLYILKPTRNYAFSEDAEYRDVIFIAKNTRPSADHRVKFCLVKQDLKHLTEDDSATIAEAIERETRLRSDKLDIEEFPLSNVQARFSNMMWFCGVTDLRHRDVITSFTKRFDGTLAHCPIESFREGYRPVPKGVSQFLFLTRNTDESRVEQAFLRFTSDDDRTIVASSPLGATYEIKRSDLTPTLRTTVGIKRMDITGACDYIAHKEYDELDRVSRASGQHKPAALFWSKVHNELRAVETHVVVSHRFNPFSPSTYANAFFSESPISPSNQVNVIVEADADRAKALCSVLNSVIFYAQFFLLKEESTGRYINIRFYDLAAMILAPTGERVRPLARVFRKYAAVDFPPLRDQFDVDFDSRYHEFWEKQRQPVSTGRLWAFRDKPIRPADVRLEFDQAVCEAVGVPVTPEALQRVYAVIVKEMILTRGLTRD